MSNLFETSVLFSDIHFGYRSNSKKHNLTCLEYIDWLIAECKARGIKTCFFLGDFFHNRATINLDTLNFGIEAVRRLSEYFDNVYMLVGNHDMYFRQKRDVTSVEWTDIFENVHLINEPTTMGDCCFLPFLVQDEWKDLENLTAKYVYGHLELPGYKLNNLMEMQDRGKESDKAFSKCEYVFSGHFHKRQYRILDSKAEIHYIGNPFPHNFNDAWDDARGCVFLEWDGEPVYHNWDNAPKFRTANMIDLLEDPEMYLQDNVTIKVNLDVQLTVEEIAYIRETYKTAYNLDDFKVTGNRGASADASSYDSDVKVESVDQVVHEEINNIDSNTLDLVLLAEIYDNLEGSI